MKTAIKLFFLLFSTGYLISCAGLFQKKIDLPEHALPWSLERRITWDDFMGEPIFEDGSIVTEILVQNPAYLNKPHLLLPTNIQVFCYMDRKNSWADKSKVTDELLLYNQTIFDFFELYARKLRKNLSEIKFGVDPTQQFNNIVQANNDELMDILKQFRTESSMGQNTDVVSDWAEKILRQISELNQFKSN